MLTVVQRVSEASITIKQNVTARIQQGLVILCGFEPRDDNVTLQKMLNKCLHYRIFSDQQGKMNLSLQDVQGGLLLVPQFTLIADTTRGLRPSFTKGASPTHGQTLFETLVQLAKEQYNCVESGIFGADMQVSLCNDGPVTFSLAF